DHRRALARGRCAAHRARAGAGGGGSGRGAGPEARGKMIDAKDIDLPDGVGGGTAAFPRHEQGLGANDAPRLDDGFRVDPRTIRYGIGENLYGHAEIAAFRGARSPVGLARTLSRTVITSYGRDVAVASTLFHRTPGKLGRQMQTWMRFPDGWHVV